MSNHAIFAVFESARVIILFNENKITSASSTILYLSCKTDTTKVSCNNNEKLFLVNLHLKFNIRR